MEQGGTTGGGTTGATGRTILVVEDDAAVLATLVEALTEEGYAVRQAMHGMEALRELSEHPPDLVVADVHLPQFGEGQLVRRLREHNLPVVLISGDPNFARTPGVAFVPKPFDLDHLLAVVANLLAEPESES